MRTPTIAGLVAFGLSLAGCVTAPDPPAPPAFAEAVDRLQRRLAEREEAKPVTQAKPVAERKAAAPAPAPRPEKKSKPVNDVPVNPLD